MAAPNPSMSGPGIQYVASNISPSSSLTERVFLGWYDKEHLPDIVKTSGMPNAFRTFHVDKSSPYGTPKCPKPFFAFYPMPDLAFTQSEEFMRDIRIKSEKLPGSGIVFDVAEFDVGFYGLVGKSGGGGGEARPTFFVCLGVEVAEGVSDGDVANALDQLTVTVSKAESYLHWRKFKLQHAQTNANTADGNDAKMPTWLVIHSFSAESTSDIREIIRKDSNRVLRNAKQVQVNAYRLQTVQGKGTFFDTDEDGTVKGWERESAYTRQKFVRSKL